MRSSTTPGHPRSTNRLRNLTLVGACTFLFTTSVAASGAAEDDASLQTFATARLDAIRDHLNTANDLDVMVAASVHDADGSIAAPPRRSSFAFSRPNEQNPFRFSIHSWWTEEIRAPNPIGSILRPVSVHMGPCALGPCGFAN